MKQTKQHFKPLQDKLKAYSSLGVAMLAMAPAADATVQCTDINLSFTVGDPNFLLDIDGDGNTDFRFSFNYGSSSVAIEANTYYGTNNAVMGSIVEAIPVPYGGTISAGQAFASTTSWLSVCASINNPFCGVANGFVGVQFTIGGSTHFGWVELSVPDNSNYTIHAVGWEDAPNTAVAAGICPSPPVAIPTAGEWGLITLALMLMSLGTVLVTRREGVLLAMQNQKGENSGYQFTLQKPPFVKSLYLKALVATTCLAAFAGVLSFAVYGSITLTDVMGTLIAGPIFAYLMHLFAMSEKILHGEEVDSQ